MADAILVSEESTMNRSSSHQIVSELRVAEVHLKTNGNSTYGEENSPDTALGQEEIPGLRPSSEPALLIIVETNLISLVSYLQQERR